MRTEPAFRREAAATWGIKIWKKDRSVFGRNWQAQRTAIAYHTNSTGRAPSATATNAGVRHVIAQAGFEHAQAFRHANRPAVAVRQIDHAAAALIQRAHAASDQNKSDQADISNQKIIYDAVDDALLRSGPDLTSGEILRSPLRGATVMHDPSSALIEAEHGKRRNEHRCRQQKRRRRLEERLYAKPEIQSNAGVNPRYDQNNEHQPHLVWPYHPVRVKHLRIEFLMLEQHVVNPHTGKMGDDEGRDT